MWRRILAIAVLGAVGHAQMIDVTAGVQMAPDQQPPVSTQPEAGDISILQTQSPGQPTLNPNASSPVPFLSSYQRHNNLRRERDEEMVVIMCIPSLRAKNCPLSPITNQLGLIPVTLRMDPEPGFQVRFRGGNEFRPRQQGEPVPTGIKLRTFRLKIRADKNVSLGEHILQGKLAFRTVTAGRSSEIQEIPVNIAVNVVEHDAQVTEFHWSLEQRRHPDIGETILIVLTAPFWFPLLLIFAATCGHDCN